MHAYIYGIVNIQEVLRVPPTINVREDWGEVGGWR
jgi:hypothetical protein